MTTKPAGWHHTKETRKKMSLSHIGMKYPSRKRPEPFTKEHRQNISKAIKKWWKVRLRQLKKQKGGRRGYSLVRNVFVR